jgi:chaperone modulatory protein CbpM
MTPLAEVAARHRDVALAELELWISRRWLRAERGADGAWQLTEMDEARLRLLVELRGTLEVNEDTMPMVLSLIDQLYDARRTIRGLLGALQAQPEAVRAAVLAAARREK